jgi:hypothetical protein
MFWSTEGFISLLIVALSTGLFSFWCARALVILAGSEKDINLTLDRDLQWSRKAWFVL